MIFWPKHILTEVDSQILISQYRDTLGFYHHIHQLLTKDPESPYAQHGGDPLPLDQFLWAFSVISSRHLTLNNSATPSDDASLQLLVMPLLDFLNHSPDPNVVALPFHDKINNESFVLIQALRDIKKGEQLLMSYGALSNSHLLQKYGFTLPDNANNALSFNAQFYEYSALLGEETKLKQVARARLGFPQLTTRFPLTLYKGRFSQEMVRQLRLSFLTSKNIMEGEGSQYFSEAETYKDPFDPSNEQITF